MNRERVFPTNLRGSWQAKRTCDEEGEASGIQHLAKRSQLRFKLFGSCASVKRVRRTSHILKSLYQQPKKILD